MARWLGKLVRSASGATAIEYGLIAALVVITAMGGISFLGSSVNGRWGDVTNKVSAVEH